MIRSARFAVVDERGWEHDDTLYRGPPTIGSQSMTIDQIRSAVLTAKIVFWGLLLIVGIIGIIEMVLDFGRLALLIL